MNQRRKGIKEESETSRRRQIITNVEHILVGAWCVIVLLIVAKLLAEFLTP